MYLDFFTQRLFINPIDINDSEFILKLLNSKGWLENIGDRNIKKKEDAEKYILKILNNPNFYYFVISLKETKKPIGIITYLQRENYEFPDIGFAILPEYERNGYIFEASNEYLTIISQKIKSIIGITLPNNLGSINLLKKLGFNFLENKTENDQEFNVYLKIF